MQLNARKAPSVMAIMKTPGVGSFATRRVAGAGAFAPQRAAFMAASYAGGNKAARQNAGLLQGLWKQRSADASSAAAANVGDFYRDVDEQLFPSQAERKAQTVLGGLLW